ncbi:unnamed protein product, partial [Bathycoccus prasinos]
ESASFKARTTRVSNPVRSPRFRTSVSGVHQKIAFALEFNLSSGNSIFLLHPQREETVLNAHPKKPFGLSQTTTSLHLHALYAQLIRITLAPPVLPRLLAQNLPELLL